MNNNLIIQLPYDNNNKFHVCALLNHLIEKGRSYIIQGAQHDPLELHRRQNSLDYWIRNKIAEKTDTAQAVNEVVDQLVNTGLFEKGEFTCPDSGHKAKGIKLKNGEL